MEIVSTAVYVGPNVYAKLPLIRFTVGRSTPARTSCVIAVCRSVWR